MEKLKDIDAPLRTGGNDRPDPFAPLTPRGTARPLGDATINDHEANRLFGQIIGRFDVRGGDELKVLSPVLLKAGRQVLRVVRLRDLLTRFGHHLIPGVLQRLLKGGWRQVITPMNHLEQRFQRLTQPFAIGLGRRIAQGREILHVANQMGQAELHRDRGIEAHIFPVCAEIITPDDPRKFSTKHLKQDLAPPGRVDPKQRIQIGVETPGPEAVAVVLMTGLVDMDGGLVRQRSQQRLEGRLQRVGHLGDELAQVAPRHPDSNDVAQKLPDGAERRMAHPFHIRHQGRESRTEQTASFDRRRKRRIMNGSTTWTPGCVTAMRVDPNRHVADLHLLNHPGGLLGVFERRAAVRAHGQRILHRPIKPFRRKGDPFMLGMAWLSAYFLRGLNVCLVRLFRWFHEIARWRLRRRRRVLASLGQFAFQLRDALLETVIFLNECRDKMLQFDFTFSHEERITTHNETCQQEFYDNVSF